MDLFISNPWEGNVRELENLIEGIMSIYDIEIIDIEHLPTKFKQIKDLEGGESIPKSQL